MRLISSGEKKKQFNPVGGEERFWLGPEGGQYSIYFQKGDSFNIAHWQVPPVVDTVAYDVLQSDQIVGNVFQKCTSSQIIRVQHFISILIEQLNCLIKIRLKKNYR